MNIAKIGFPLTFTQGEGPTTNRRVQRCFQKFCSADESFEDEGGRRRWCNLENE